MPLSSLKIHTSWTQKTGTFLNSIKLKWSPKHGRCIKYAFSLPVGYGLLTFKLHPKTALCAPKVKHSRLVKEDGGGGSDTKFDWKQFFQMLVPEMWYLLAAVIVSSLHITGLNMMIKDLIVKNILQLTSSLLIDFFLSLLKLSLYKLLEKPNSVFYLRILWFPNFVGINFRGFSRIQSFENSYRYYVLFVIFTGLRDLIHLVISHRLR